MKKFTYYLHLSLIIFSGTVFLSCSNSNSTEKVYLSSLTGNKKNVKLADTDFRFLVKAYSLGLYKISLAKEAQIRSTSAESNQLANAVVGFHTNLNNQINDIAATYSFSLPIDLTDEHKALWKQLVKEKGWNFDKKFADMLCDLKQEEAVVFDHAISHASDKNVTLLAQKAGPDLQLQELLRNTLNEKIAEKTNDIVSVEEPDTKVKGKVAGAKAKS